MGYLTGEQGYVLMGVDRDRRHRVGGETERTAKMEMIQAMRSIAEAEWVGYWDGTEIDGSIVAGVWHGGLYVAMYVFEAGESGGVHEIEGWNYMDEPSRLEVQASFEERITEQTMLEQAEVQG